MPLPFPSLAGDGRQRVQQGSPSHGNRNWSGGRFIATTSVEIFTALQDGDLEGSFTTPIESQLPPAECKASRPRLNQSA